MSPILQVEGLSKRFGKVVTAEDLSFSVEQGSALGIVGPNGAGKSTLLSLITGVTLVSGIFILVANLVVDLLYGVLDPRVRTA